MRRFLLLFSTAVFAIHSPLYAKRAHIQYPDTIIIKNIEYKATYEYGNLFQKAFIEAKSTETEEILWKKEIYKIVLNPTLEHDVQWVMITDVKKEKGKLLISNERSEKFILNLETLEVNK